MNRKNSAFILAVFGLWAAVHSACAQGTAFTYQGQLMSSNVPASGDFDFVFGLFNASTGGSQQGVSITNLGVSVSNGLFVVTNDFGAGPWTGQPLWMQLQVRTNTGGTFIALAPRQALTSTPYAIQSLNAASATTATTAGTAGSVAAANITGVGTLPAAVLPSSVVINNQTNVTLSGAFIGNGSGLSNLNASNLTTGVLPLAVQNPAVVTNGASGVALAGTFSGNGTNLILGQSAYSVYGTASLTLTAAAGLTYIPGLTQTLTISSNSVLYISTSGGVQTSSSVANGYSEVLIEILIDGVVVNLGGVQFVFPVNNASVAQVSQNWSMAVPEVLGSGTHTIAVAARGTGIGSTAIISGNSSSVFQGGLSVLILKQ